MPPRNTTQTTRKSKAARPKRHAASSAGGEPPGLAAESANTVSLGREPDYVLLANDIKREIDLLVILAKNYPEARARHTCTLKRYASDLGVDPKKHARKALMWRIDCLARGQQIDEGSGASLYLLLEGAYGVSDADLARVVAVWLERAGAKRTADGRRRSKWEELARVLRDRLEDPTAATTLQREWQEAKSDAHARASVARTNTAPNPDRGV